MNDKDLDEKIKKFEERLEEKKRKEAEEEKAKTEKLRQQYMNRTGRKEMKP